MATNVSPAQLQAGDVLLMQGDSLISDFIRIFDQGQYSHAAIFDGHNVVEMLAQGTTVRSLEESVVDTRFVDVYRFVGSDGTPLGSPGLERQPVLDRIQHYVDAGEQYGYEQILLLALLCATRREAQENLTPVQALILRRILDSAAEVVATMIHAGHTPMICSELVYKCYTEAGSRYAILVRGADLPAAAPLGALESLAPGRAAAAPAAQSAFQEEASRFLLNYAVAKRHNVAAREFATAATPAAIVAASAVADFVTPHDLETSPSLQLAGTLA
jgi:hypothetical protein